MSRRDDSSGDLSDVRREIDEIDDAILSLLKRRFGVVARVKEIKGLRDGAAGTPMRPAREAQVIRRLVGAAGSELPGRVVARLWMELIAAASRFQSPISIHLPSSASRIAYQDLIRFHAGAETPVIEHERAEDVIDAAAQSAADIALCPLDDGSGSVRDEERRCMEALIRAGNSGMQVVARLPFIKGASAVEGLVVGKVPFEPSGDDVTLFAVTGSMPDPEVLRELGLNMVHPPRAYYGGACHVVTIDGHVEADDERLATVSGNWTRIGGYAKAIDLGETS